LRRLLVAKELSAAVHPRLVFILREPRCFVRRLVFRVVDEQTAHFLFVFELACTLRAQGLLFA
jgi:hypothetical protein